MGWEVPFFFPCDALWLLRTALFLVLHASHSTSLLKRINKVRLFVEKILSKFQKKYTPTRDLAVDETMLKFHGRSAGKQYMPNKSTKWGIKCFSLADISNGYMQIYSHVAEWLSMRWSCQFSLCDSDCSGCWHLHGHTIQQEGGAEARYLMANSLLLHISKPGGWAFSAVLENGAVHHCCLCKPRKLSPPLTLLHRKE